ncbi:MAG: SpoIID/LytB domain-containing protein [Clostridia bacterium]|nr:SpoIID/LytB domain-containing protein [Clostridia bacterium]MDD4146156.1 SpoIID/LytB domain-containing protein [Clostridia bacterium]MDD4665591.1 SpoIID/LytB domain-containing protein [Clostridia bacterium]
MNWQGTAKKSCLFLLLMLLGIIFICLVSTSLVQAAQIACTPATIRVALGLNLTSVDFFVSEGNYELVDCLTQRVISSDLFTGTWVVAPAGSANIQIYNNGQPLEGLGSSLLLLRQKNDQEQNVFCFGKKNYRGNLLLENIQGKIHAINYLDVEQYLYGVVGAEMGPGAPEEAYKAQAVVSRTYAFYSKEHPQLNYDLGISTQWQVYGGYDTEILSSPLVKKAVDETRGQVICYDRELIQAFFHSNSGGYTEACENVWLESLPYLQPIVTPEDVVAMQVAQNLSWTAETYLWEKSFSRQELMNQLEKWNRAHPNNAVNVGEIYDLSVKRWAVDPQTKEFLAKETASGRVTQLSFTGSKGAKSFYRDMIRSVLGLRSTLFEVICNSTVKIWNAFGSLDFYSYTKDLKAVNADGYITALNGNNEEYYVLGADGLQTIPKVFSEVTFKGKGYGHGLGMSQWGAWGMALRGAKYDEIIEHFYNQDKNDGRLRIQAY